MVSLVRDRRVAREASEGSSSSSRELFVEDELERLRKAKGSTISGGSGKARSGGKTAQPLMDGEAMQRMRKVSQRLQRGGKTHKQSAAASSQAAVKAVASAAAMHMSWEGERR